MTKAGLMFVLVISIAVNAQLGGSILKLGSLHAFVKP